VVAIFGLSVLAAVTPSASAARHRSAPAAPTLSGPVTGGSPGTLVNATVPSLKRRFGYTEREFFVAGTATAYRPDGAWTDDGKWAVKPTTTAPYKSRIVVRAPKNPKKFSGVVVVEWFNETSGRDADPDFGFAHEQMLRHGDAYVGVSAQAAGVVGGGPKIPIAGYNPLPLVQWDPQRYGTLTHPGDDYSYDIFTQAARAIRDPNGVKPLGSLTPRKLIATGESQSAGRMVTYVNAIQPLTHAFDGFLIHSRGSSGTNLSATAPAPPPVAHIRADLGVPVMQTETETDLFGLHFFPARQPDTTRLRTWEMAGTSHADQATLDYGFTAGRAWNKTDPLPDFTAMCGSINNGPQTAMMDGAFAALVRWVTAGKAPAHSPTMQDTNGTTIARDAHGNVLGGIRTPAVDVPISALSGEADTTKSPICSLFGTSKPFDAATLRSLYPTHASYVGKVRESASAAVRQGFVPAYDAAALIKAANIAGIPG